jgi:hypothetical protein
MEEKSMAGEPDGAKSSRLFLLRIWQDGGGWRGRLVDLANGEQAFVFAGGQPDRAAVLLQVEAAEE